MRVCLTLLLAAILTLAGAQQKPAPGAGQQALSWLQTQWHRVQTEGRPAAERIVRQFPERFKNIKAQVARLTAVASQIADPARLEEKKDLLLELWRVRGSLNLLALCSPDALHQITGLDTQTLASLQAQLASVRARLDGSHR